MTHSQLHDSAFMRDAIQLAKKAQWMTAPNPCVGAVLVKENIIVAKGWHKGVGLPHAEIECLADASAHGVDPSQCSLYVTLEPCNHHGKTPPCTQAILQAGIKHVVFGATDPSKSGGGAALLRQHGISVTEGVEKQACLDLINDFLTWETTRLPYTLLKLASTLDGRIATRTGHSKWITSNETRRHVHTLRKHMQALIIGGNTFYLDDPKLTCRDQDGGSDNISQPFAVIVTSRLPDAGANQYLLRQRASESIFWTTVAAAASPKAEALRKMGARIFGLPSKPTNSPRGYGMRAALSLNEGLEYLRQELKCHYVMCEGGGRLGLSLLESNLTHELHLHLAPKILGDNEAMPLFDGRAPLLMDEALPLRITESMTSSSDILLVLRPALETESKENPSHAEHK